MLESLLRNLLPLFWAFLISVFAVPSIVQVAHKKRLLDEPNDRTMHELLTPRLGGLAIFAGFISALTIFGKIDYGVQHTIAGSVILFFIGLKDDIVSVSAFKKFFVQVLTAGIVMFMADIRVSGFQGVLGIGELDLGMSYLFTFVVIIGLVNAINLIDGLDGLAGSIVSLSCIAFGIYFSMSDDPIYYAYASMAFSLLGGMLGFLRYNIYKAKIFMGDTGSLISGFILAVLAIKFIEMKIVANAPSISMAILIIPILDTGRVFILRILAGKSPFTPDKNHIHHKLIELEFSQLSTVLILLLVNVMAISLVLYFDFLSLTVQLVMLIVFAVMFSLLLEIGVGVKKANATRNEKVNV